MRILLLCFSLLTVSSIAAPSALAQDKGKDREKIVGTWKLASIAYEDVATKQRTRVLGANSRGYQIATANGRWMAIVATPKQQAPKTDSELLQNLRPFVAYSGSYRVANDTIVTTLDVASNEAWVGTDQIVKYKFQGDDELQFELPEEPHPADTKKRIRIIVTWQRDKP